jgi:N-omega-hydroxy-L-arginine synthase
VSVSRIKTLLSRLPTWSLQGEPNVPAELSAEVASMIENLGMRIRDLQSAIDAANLGPHAAALDVHLRGIAEVLGCGANREATYATNRDIGIRYQPVDTIISWRDLASLSARDRSSGSPVGIPDWVPAAFHQVTSIIAREGFPCIFARQANHLMSGWACFVDSVETEAGREHVRRAILTYIDVLKQLPLSRTAIMPLSVIVKPCDPMLSLGEYRDQAWGLFQYLHDHDPEPWPGDVPTDPDRGDWSFCFGGIQLFSNVSTPAHEIHKSRNLGDSLVFAMQPRTNFDLVGGNNKKGRQVRSEIRARAERYEGRPVASHLGYFGTPENREWLQMVAKDSEADLDYPTVCPFRFNANKNALPK